MTFREYDDDQPENTSVELRESVRRLTRDLAQAGQTMGPREARFLVDAYYSSQDNRKRSRNQALAMERIAREQGLPSEPHVLIDWLFEQSRILESQIRRALDQYTQAHVMGSWLRQIYGVGPVISAGLLANLEKPRNTAGKIYAFAGIAGDGQKPWKTGEKRPYNVQLKTLCWHAGQSFMKFAGQEECFYGHLYRERKAFEQRMSDEGKRAETAAEWLPRVKKTTEAYGWYSQGKLPPSQIDGRARRWAVKMFLSHVNEVWLIRTGQAPAKPFALARLHHVDYIPPPIPA